MGRALNEGRDIFHASLLPHSALESMDFQLPRGVSLLPGRWRGDAIGLRDRSYRPESLAHPRIESRRSHARVHPGRVRGSALSAMERYRDVHTKKEGSRTHFRLMTPGDEFVKKLERFIGGTNESTNENTSIRYAYTVTRSNQSARHCTARLPIVAELQHRYFLAEKGNNESLRGPTSRAGMTTTIWRPRVRIDVPDVGDAENTDTSREELSKKGTKRKRAPRHHGPCEHGVKHRSRCKVCSGCPHGRLPRSQCKECGGSGICEHGRVRHQCKECGGASICEHGRVRSVCKECGGSAFCEHGRRRSECKECGGKGICEHGRVRYNCKECGGSQICEHGRRRSQCKECGGASLCEHGRQRSYCKECGGSGICEHGRVRCRCKECGGASICEHGRRRHQCKECPSARV
jgi:hypothetical protein